MKRLLSMVMLLSIVQAASLPLYAKDVKTKDFSGYLQDYDSLVFSEDLNAFVFFNEEMRGKFSKVLLQSITFYARDAKAEGEIANQAADYMRDGVTRLLEQRGLLATKPGPEVLRYHMAITGVEKSKESLKPYNLIPASALFRGAQEATGKVATYIDVMFEGEMVDSVTGERAAAIVRRGIGATDKRSGDQLTFEDVQPTLDMWLESYAAMLNAYMSKAR
jgi:hypothetical protein